MFESLKIKIKQDIEKRIRDKMVEQGTIMTEKMKSLVEDSEVTVIKGINEAKIEFKTHLDQDEVSTFTKKVDDIVRGV